MKVSGAVPAVIAAQAHRRLPPPLPLQRASEPKGAADSARPAPGVPADRTRGTRLDLRV